ncbi:hypothetical protein Hypma_010288 [Hypsizygus marmoreus]|uniref:Uncharacterized protein n=1 Tax=Hypsizygus marmoreus TaxID=39966 RepID=A0A369JJV1_HYPMA|nr:hypothetical protein Hypma_010288 [Hypsizygus marmoreus]
MTSNVADVSSKLGDYMLKGWVLTDQTCPTPGCSVPMLRSPRGRTPVTQFCASCDGGPEVPQQQPTAAVSDSASSMASDSHISRSSTPPTEISSTLSSPVFAPPAETEEIRRRREQSDTASTEIGKRLLKGWAMLDAECPNPRCYGIPLVRPPKPGGEKDPRKECVICGGIYLTEIDWAGRERLVPANVEVPKTEPNSSSTVSVSSAKGKASERISVDTPHPQEPNDMIPPLTLAPVIPPQPETSTALVQVQPAFSPHVLQETSQALQSTLHALSARLTALSSPHTVIDPSSIGVTAEAISKVTQALSHVRQLQRNENRIP